MPGQLLPGDGSLEDYKNELKECLKENIHHKREIKQLRQQRKDIEVKQSLMEKEHEDVKLGQATEIQKAVRKVEMRNRQLQTRLQEMKKEQDDLQKHNKDFKDYYEKQQDRMNALRNVNQNLTKKLQQKLQRKVDLEME